MTEHHENHGKHDDHAVDPRQAALNAWLDGERTAAGVADVEARLADAPELRADADAFAALDRDLRDAFAQGRVRADANTAATLERLNLRAADRPARRPGGRVLGYIAGLVASTAAGFAIALLVFPPTDVSARKTPIGNDGGIANAANADHHDGNVGRNANTDTSNGNNGNNGNNGTDDNADNNGMDMYAQSVAHLSVAAAAKVRLCGPADVDADGLPVADAWTDLPIGATVPAGAWVRTDTPCELVGIDGTELRLNANTQVRLIATREARLAEGQIYAAVAPDETAPYRVHAGPAVVTAFGTQFDLSASQEAVRLAVLEGATRISAVGEVRNVGAGQAVTLEGGQLSHVQAARDLLLATRWVNEILVLKGRDDPELNARIDEIFSQIGHDKLKYLYEEEIRALGDHCVLPLCRYLESEQSLEEPEMRVKAARILSDIASPWAIPELIELLRDDDGEVRAHIADGLTRLTGHTMGREPTAWSDPWSACESTYDKWVKWWAENQAKVPGSRSWIDD